VTWVLYNHYNLTIMNQATAVRLIELNRDFYTRFGDSFSATRHRIQPGVRCVLEMLGGDENVLDLGCGNGWFARELAKRGHLGTYLGVDFSLPLLRDAGSYSKEFSAKFMEADLTQLSAYSDRLLTTGHWSVITSFATLHHIPSHEIRLDILRIVHKLLKPSGHFIHSNWQFLNSEKLKSRIQDWSKAGLSPSEVDPNDYLLDWRSGGEGLRYVHHFEEDELSELAQVNGFQIMDKFFSDGETGNLGLYEVWQK
jgi:tRNA (uracil-5-)-methyltransferase TRM9